MAKYLMAITSRSDLSALAGQPAPTDYLVETRAQDTGEEDDGLAHWTIDLQLAGALADWVKSPAYDALWSYLQAVVAPLELRPRAELRVRSRFDPHTVSAVVAYLGDHELKRAAEELKRRLEAVVEPKTRKLKSDVSVAF